MIIETALKGSLRRLATKKRDNTLKTYRTGLTSFKAYLRSLDIDPLTCSTDKLTAGIFLHYPDYLQDKIIEANERVDAAKKKAEETKQPMESVETFTLRTARVYLAAVINFQRWVSQEGLFDPSPQEIEKIRSRNRDIMEGNPQTSPKMEIINQAPRVLEMAYEILEITQKTPYKREKAKERDVLICYRNIAICEVLMAAGLRNHELCNLRVGDLNISNVMHRGENTVLAQAHIIGKGNKQRKVFINAKAVRALQTYWEKRGWANTKDPVIARHNRNVGNGHLPVSVNTVETEVGKLAARAGVDFHPHLFRHWFAVEMIDKTKNIALVQDYMGHSDPKTTRIYAQIREKELRDTYLDAQRDDQEPDNSKDSENKEG